MSEILNSLIELQFIFRKDPVKNAKQELALIILKPNYTEEHESHVENFIKHNALNIMHEASFLLDRKAVLVLYNDIFRFCSSDVKFGVNWKLDKMNYMVSGPSKVYVVCGNKAKYLSEKLKHEIRNKYNKLSIPEKTLDRNTFLEFAIKNIIHVVDDQDIESTLWLLSLLNY